MAGHGCYTVATEGDVQEARTFLLFPIWAANARYLRAPRPDPAATERSPHIMARAFIYIYNDAKSICARHIASNRGQTPARLANESHHDLPPICEWKQWDGTASPGYHYAKDLTDVRSQLLLTGRGPRVVLRNAASADMVAAEIHLHQIH